MRNPVAALRARRAIVRSAFATLEADIKNQAAWRPIRDHFVGVHRIPRARFGPADEELRNYFTYAIGHRKTLVDIKEALASRITFWTTTPEGKKEVEDVIRSSGAAFFKKSEADMASRAKALRRLRKEKGALMEAPSKPPKGQHDLIALSRMYAEDLAKLPEHWKK